MRIRAFSRFFRGHMHWPPAARNRLRFACKHHVASPGIIGLYKFCANRIGARGVAGRSEAIGAANAAALCGISKPSWDRMNAAGKTPQPVWLLGSVRWMRSEILAWLTAGAPDRVRWEAMKKRK